MSADLIALGVQLRDAGKLRWYSGMVALVGRRRIRLAWVRRSAAYPPIEGGGAPDGDEWFAPYGNLLDAGAVDLSEALPDFTDPLTAASPLLMAREAWEDPSLYAQAHCNGDGHIRYTVRGWRGGFLHTYSDRVFDTEIEALVAAILAAPVRP